MDLKPISLKRLVLIASVCCASIVLVLLRFAPTVLSRSAALEHDLDQRFLAHQLLQLNASSVLQQVHDTGRLSFASSDLSFDVELVPHDLRAPGYRAEVFGADGVGHPIDVGPVRTFKGRARGSQGGKQLPQLGEARFTIEENGIQGLIITPTEHYFVEPARKFSKAAITSEYVLYRESDVVTNSNGDCGATLSEQVNDKAEELSASSAGDSLQINAAAGLHELRIATEADNEYVISKSDAAAADREILSILNKVEGLYEVELGLNLRVVYQSAWSTANDPFSSTNPSALLGELANFWNSNRGSVARDVVHMWTGRQLENATFGTAYLESLCRFTSGGRAAYGLSKAISNDSQQVAVTAHEISHNLGATHPNQQVPPVADCSNSIMTSSVNTDSRLTFCQFSRNEMANYLAASAGCLGGSTTGLKFAVSIPFPLGGGPQAITSADLNGDGKQDLATANSDGTVSVLLGTDSGALQEAGGSPFPAGSSPSAITTADFNGDGRKDLAVANSGSNNVSVLLGTGNGSFLTATGSPFAAGLTPSSITAADFNRDGKVDLAVANSAGGNASVLNGTGSGSFLAAVNYPTGSAPSSITTADFNRDGNQDLAVTNANSNNVSVLLGAGASGFQPAVNYPTDSFPLSIVAGDFNNDDRVDLIIANKNTPNVTLQRGNGDGTFQASLPVFYPPGSKLNSITAGDFNGDGKLDLAISVLGVVSGGDSSYISVRLGTGDGLFSSQIIVLANGFTTVVANGDLNGDGKIDLAAVTSSGLSTLFGRGDGSFLAVTSYGFGEDPRAMIAGDYNSDGNIDLVALDTNSDFDDTVSVLLGKGDGTFGIGSFFVQPSSLSFGSALTKGDFNGDKVIDLASAGGSADKTVSIFLGNNTGGFRPSFRFSVGDLPIGITSGDFNNDGHDDLALANSGKTISILFSTNTGSFQPAVNYPTNNSPTMITTGDFNGDNKPDIASTGMLMLGRADGSFDVINNPDIGGVPGDFNGDGKLDLITSSKYLRGRGDGTFDAITGPGFGASGIAGDFNGDGKLDIAANTFSTVQVQLGNGDGSFQSAIGFLIGSSIRGLVAADFNHDNKLDLATTTRLVNQFQFRGLAGILLNISGESLAVPDNDNFASARIITGPNGTLAGTTILATKEIGEPNHASASNGTGGASIWYRWTAPSKGKFYFQTFSSSFPNAIAIYTGTSVGALASVIKSTSAVPEYVELNATEGTTYQIAIDGITGDTGRTVLTWNTGSLTNDNFAFAREIRGSGGSVNGNNINFTLEPKEPVLPGPTSAQFSAWYRWTAPNTGKVSFSTAPCGDTTRLLGAYTGNFIDALIPVAVNYDGYRDFDDPGICDNRTLRFNAIAGTTYYVQLRSATAGPFTLEWNYANPPPNDNFTNALVLAGNSGSLTSSNKDATKEPGEPNHAGGPGGASIWYRWTAPTSGKVTFDTIGFRSQTTNSFRYLTALIAVYTGSDLSTLTAVTANATDNKVIFNATAGTTYHIAIDSAPYAGGGYLPGIVPLHWGTKQVANDDFANAQPLTASDSFVPILGSNAGATKETGEPNHAGSVGGTSVWYRWTALTTGNVSFVLNHCLTCTLPTNDARVGVYINGASVNGLIHVLVTTDNNHTFTAVRGTTYFIAVDSNTGSGGTYEFSLVSANISARNDAFAKAQVLSGSAGSVAGDNSGATKEALEPNHANDIGGASVWHQWTAPASGLYTFDTFGSNFDTLLAVYTGNAVNALTVVASSDNAKSSAQSRLTFDAKVNTTYYIAVDGKSNGVEQGTGLARSQTGFILLNWNNLPAPANDNFASAQLISGASGNVTGRNTVASKEGGEPNHAATPGGASVWYRWIAPFSGNFTFNTFSSDFNTILAIYSGSELTTLTPVSANDDAGASTQSRVTFNAVAGTVYYIAIDGSPGVPGNVTPFSGNIILSWFPQTGIINDNFANAQPLSGSAGSLAATNAGAGKENGEPNHANPGGRSVWYSWTAPFSGPVLFTTSGSDFDTLLAIYLGNSVNGLTLVSSNDDSPYTDNLTHTLTSSLTFTAVAGTTYKIAVDGSGGRFGNFALRWGPDAKIKGLVSFVSGKCGSDKTVTMILSGDDARFVTLNGSGTYTFEHLRVGGNYSVRGVSEASAICLPLFLERAQNALPLTGDVPNADFIDDGLRGGGSTSNITGTVKNAAGVGLQNVAMGLSGSASRTVYTDGAGIYVLPSLPQGTYQLTPIRAGSVFSPAVKEYNLTVGQSLTGQDFIAQESFNISGQTQDLNGAALGGVTVTLNNGVQPMSAQTDENGYYSFDAMAGGSYTLIAAKTGLSFSPASKTISGLNANQKNVDFTVTQTQTLTVASVNPGSGVTITVSPIDNNSQGTGTTQLSRTYNLNTNVSLTALLTTGGNIFQKWLKDGADYSTDLFTNVLMDANHTMTAVYLTTAVQTPQGQNLTVQLNGVTVTFANVTSAGITNITPINPTAAGQLPNAYQLTGSSVAFDISTTAVVQPPISVCFNVPSITDAAFFSQLRILHSENGTLVDHTSSQNFTTKTICASVNSLSQFVLVTTTVQQLQLLLEEPVAPTMQAAALDSVLLLRDPFPVVNSPNLLRGQDLNTRVLLFVKNVQLAPGESAGAIVVHLVGANGQTYDVPAENLFSLPGFDFSQLTFRLPDTLAPGTCTIEVRAHGQFSNLGTIRIRP